MSKKQLEELDTKFKHKYGLDLDFDSLYSENKSEEEIYNLIKSIIEDLSIDIKLKDRLKKELLESLSQSLKSKNPSNEETLQKENTKTINHNDGSKTINKYDNEGYLIQEIYENDKTKTKIITNYKYDNMLHGKTERYEEGKLKRVHFFDNGKYLGKIKVGENVVKVEMTDREEDGTYSINSYNKNGELEGECKDYYSNSRIRSKKNYSNGLEEGKHTYYQFVEEGEDRRERVENWKNGKLHGIETEFDKNGNISSETEFNNGKSVQSKNFKYDSERQLVSYNIEKTGSYLIETYNKDNELIKTTKYYSEEEIKDKKLRGEKIEPVIINYETKSQLKEKRLEEIKRGLKSNKPSQRDIVKNKVQQSQNDISQSIDNDYNSPSF